MTSAAEEAVPRANHSLPALGVPHTFPQPDPTVHRARLCQGKTQPWGSSRGPGMFQNAGAGCAGAGRDVAQFRIAI